MLALVGNLSSAFCYSSSVLSDDVRAASVDLATVIRRLLCLASLSALPSISSSVVAPGR